MGRNVVHTTGLHSVIRWETPVVMRCEDRRPERTGFQLLLSLMIFVRILRRASTWDFIFSILTCFCSYLLLLF